MKNHIVQHSNALSLFVVCFVLSTHCFSLLVSYLVNMIMYDSTVSILIAVYQLSLLQSSPGSEFVRNDI